MYLQRNQSIIRHEGRLESGVVSCVEQDDLATKAALPFRQRHFSNSIIIDTYQ